MVRKLFVVLCLAGTAACASGGEGGVRAGNRAVLTAEEIGTTGASNAHEAISRARPEYLRSRGTRSMRAQTAEDFPVVYLNTTRYGHIDALRSIPVGDIREIRYLGGTEATTRYGTGHGAGVILIVTR
jgi:hypothetical protein